ncbi:MAG TPA: glycoside hydrolase family 43 protein [Acidimicrobiia bacterium]|nr:glycoside hydrolase family 43 protein [Acidimicrobiia bacterium]
MMERRSRTTVGIALALVAALWLLVWLALAVVVPLFEDAPCSGIVFRAGASGPASEPAGRPPIGGTGGLAGKVRAALRPQGSAVYCHDFADPFVLRAGNTYYAYATNNQDDHIPVLTSSGLFGNAHTADALPKLPAWSSPGGVWGPAVLPRPGGFVLYYTTRAHDPDRECLSRAVSKEPGGPFVDDSSGPLVCPPDGGAIDPSPFVTADGRAYLLWKSDATAGIVAQELAPDGLSLVGDQRPLVQADQAWESGVVEAPSMVGYAGRYYLFYSGNNWSTAGYAIGYAVCDSPTGPCTKPAGGPWLASTSRAEGPGGEDVFVDANGQPWMTLHAWVRGKVGYPQGARNLFVVRLTFVDGAPVAG